MDEQRKSERISYKIRKHKKIRRDKWIIVENTHEPIIDKDTFNTVQILLKQKSYGKTEKKTEHLLGGLLVCGECGKPVTFRREKRKGKKKLHNGNEKDTPFYKYRRETYGTILYQEH